MLEFHAFASRLHALNIDGASVNTGIHRGLGARIRELAPWLTVVHCFNHRLELAVKDAFKGTFFNEIDTMLLKLYYLYKKSSKPGTDFLGGAGGCTPPPPRNFWHPSRGV